MPASLRRSGRARARPEVPARDVRRPCAGAPRVPTVGDARPARPRLWCDAGLRGVPGPEPGRLAGIVSRRDLLRTLVRPDEVIRADVVRLVEGYTGDLDSWDVTVADGMLIIRRTRGAPQVSR